jgi:hypothetical protein
LFLKSCGQKEEIQEEARVASTMVKNPHERNYSATLGIMVSEITMVDTTKKDERIEKDAPKTIFTPENVVGKIEVRPAITGDTLLAELPPLWIDTAKYEPAVNTNASDGRSGIMGGLIISMHPEKNNCQLPIGEATLEKKLANVKPSVSAYPNPIKAGNVLTVTLSDGIDYPKGVQMITSGGALISRLQPNFKTKGVFTVPIPAHLNAGTYFVQVVEQNESVKTAKIVIIN